MNAKHNNHHFGETRLFVSPNGCDKWSGKLPVANRSKTDGPFATLERAQREAGRAKTPARIMLREGVYSLAKPLEFNPRDSGQFNPADYYNGKLKYRIKFAAFQNELVVISGGRRITGWRETTLNGHKTWSVFLPDVKKGTWNFTQLWVNGRRAQRPRLPKKGLYRIMEAPQSAQKFEGQDRFVFQKGDIQSWKNLRDVEFVALHCWIDSRSAIKKIDFKTCTAYLTDKSKRKLIEGDKGAPYYIENVFEALERAGQWYLDRPSGMLYYLPRPGEKIATAEIFAPVLSQLVVIEGNQRRNQFVHGIDFEGVTFAHTELTSGVTPSGQAGCNLPGAIRFRHAWHCSLTRCRIEHMDSYGIELLDGCTDIFIRRNAITDMAGGVKVWHACRRTTIEDNVIADGGHRLHQAVGVLIGKSSGNIVRHNHIHDFDYTGISVGWTWGYAEGEAYGNVIEYNHIHDIGRGVLSDLGGIYSLGVSPGTRIRYNVIHDVRERHYGGNGLYTDEGSSEIILENNLVYRASTGYMHHYGRDNIVRNNIFAFTKKNFVQLGRAGDHCSFKFINNIVYGETGTAFIGDWSEGWTDIDRNLYFNSKGKAMTFAGKGFKAWQAMGHDRHSKIADPLFAGPNRADFSLPPKSPAFALGFMPLDLSTVGPRPLASISRRSREMATGFLNFFKVSRAMPSAGNLRALACPQNLNDLKLKAREFPNRFCDVHNDLFTCAPNDVLAYYLCEFRCAEPMRLKVCAGYDGPIKIWLNGQERFHDPHGTNPAYPDKAVIPFKASRGRHQILVALGSNSGRACGIFLRLIRTDLGQRELADGSFKMPDVIG